MNKRINSITATAALTLQVAVTISTQSAIAGVIAAAAFLIFAGPTQWEKQ